MPEQASSAYPGEIDPRGSIPGIGLTRRGRFSGELELTAATSASTMIPIEIEISRFRGNIYVDGINAWEERNWIGKIIKINKSSSFELKSSNLRSYYFKNIIAFGDLLHRLHPLAGQGFNMTIRDIKEINKLIEFQKKHAKIK